MIGRLVIALAAAIFAIGAAPARAPHADMLHLVDLTPAFDSFWTETRDMDDQHRLTAFRARFDSIIPGFYTDGARIGLTREAYDGMMLRALQTYPELRPQFLEVSRRFAALFGPARSSFEAQFGPFGRPQKVYLLHSLGEMDGGSRTLPEGLVLVFGADMIARLHLAHDIRPFFHHELFHVLHAATFGGCGNFIWCGLWEEGLAVYVAQRLNPQASDAELLLTMPEPIRPAVEAHRQEAVCASLARLDSRNPADSRAMFSSARLNDRLPPRFGYYVGYLAARELGRTHSLRQLAQMRPAQVRPLLAASLRRLATCV